jgi:hypothetical protein
MKKQTSERDIEIFKRVHSGASYASEARRTGLSVGRVRQIFFKAAGRAGAPGRSLQDARNTDPSIQALTFVHLARREQLYMLAVLRNVL